MRNDSMRAILEYFFQEATGSAESALRVAELLRGAGMSEDECASLAAATASAERLRRAIDDVRSLQSADPAPAGLRDEFDLVRCAAEVVEALNLASGKRVAPLVIVGAPEALPVMQDRGAVEELFTRVLDTAGKMAQRSQVVLCARGDGSRARLAISVGDEELAARLVDWLNADPERVQFKDPREVPFAVALLLAGRRLRALGGAAESSGCAVSLEVPSAAARAGADNSRKARPDALAVLIAEDDDESFVLTELELRDERVWRAHDGPEALRMIQDQRFDAVFMDVHMPGIMDGYQAIRKMREWETQTGSARTPIVVLSSDDPETQRRFAAECGCSGFLGKPLLRWEVTPLLDRLKQGRIAPAC